MDQPKKDPFDTADYFDIEGEGEEFTHRSPADAIGEFYDSSGLPVEETVVYAYKRRVVDDQWVDAEAYLLAESLSERYDDEYGGGNDPCIPNEELEALGKRLVPIVREVIQRHPPWQCEFVGKRTYSAEDVSQIIDGSHRMDIRSDP